MFQSTDPDPKSIFNELEREGALQCAILAALSRRRQAVINFLGSSWLGIPTCVDIASFLGYARQRAEHRQTQYKDELQGAA
jgi:hypothetical protein